MPKNREPTGGPEPTLHLDRAGKDYGDGRGLAATDLRLEPGQLVVLAGTNGAGKSTLLGLCAGLLTPTAGALTVAGHPVGSVEARRATSYIPDTPVLYDDLTVREHLEYIAGLHGPGGGVHDAWPDRAAGLLATFNLADRADDLPTRLSRGLRQKASLVVGLIRPFELLLIDEPFVGLDPPAQEALAEVLVGLAAAGRTVLASTHQLAFVDRADRCVGLRDGEVVLDGPADADEVRALLDT
jgi:ABC-type multidrug transport system ATPase subunit